MTGIVSEVKNKINNNCCVTSIKRGSCNINLSEGGNLWVIVDFDKPEAPLGLNDAKPDFLFVSNTGGTNNSGRIVPIEISQGQSKSADKIRRQLQAGVDWADKEIDKRFQSKLIPVYCGSLNKHARKRLKITKIKFRGIKEIPRIISINGKLPK